MLGRHWASLAVLTGALILFAGCPSGDDTGLTVPVSDTNSEVLQADGAPIACTVDAECASLPGQDACRVAQCDNVSGQCVLWSKPNCCVYDPDCDDGNADTIDFCDEATSVCQHTNTTEPCTSPDDCAPTEACVKAVCDGYCTYWQDPDCCTVDADCDDGDACTVDSCQASTCAHGPSSAPECCGVTLWETEFTDGLGDVDVSGNGGVVVWHWSTKRFHTEGGSARFADPAKGNYRNDLGDDGTIAASQGALQLPLVDLPEGVPATLEFWLWLDIEEPADYDRFEILAVTERDAIPVIWDKGELSSDDFRTWVRVSVDLSSMAGRTLGFMFLVDTEDGTVNTGEGVYIDSVTVAAGCAVSDCVSDSDCDDSNACTDDSCGADGQCIHTEVPGCCVTAADCEPASVCYDVQCIDSQCVASPVAGCCNVDADCDDGDECTLDTCAPGSGLCHNDPIEGCGGCTSNVECFDADPCTEDRCVGGLCIWEPIPDCTLPCTTADECADGDPCTGDFCEDGVCMWLEIPGCGGCTADDECADLNPCTQDSCAANGECLHAAIAGCTPCAEDGSCDDGDPCTVDVCGDEGICLQKPVTCDDGDACTTDTCDSALGCLSVPIPGCGVDCVVDSDCLPANPCAKGQCLDGVCVVIVLDCDDGNPCTTDACFGLTGECTNVPVDCNDGDICTLDACDTTTGQCVHQPDPACECVDDAGCDDGDVCTQDRCQDHACVNDPIAGCGPYCDGPEDCLDGDACTKDACVNGLCQNVSIPDCTPCTVAADCVDGDSCTADFCIAGECVNKPVPNCIQCSTAGDCQDLDPCTADQCINGQCQNPAIAGCTAVCEVNAQCVDDDPCTTDQCVGGQCLNAAVAGCCSSDSACDDGDPCTTDACENSSCVHSPIPGCGAECQTAAECDDGDACTADFCNDGDCEHLDIPGCIASCTSDGDCNDEDVCTADFCVAGACQNLAVPGCLPGCTGDDDCDDGNPCTVDFCGADGTCSNVSDPTLAGCCETDADCDDGDICTIHACVGGVCQLSPVIGCCVDDSECDDGDACTQDSCYLGACAFNAIPGCCTEEDWLNETFSAGIPATWLVSGQGLATWHASEARSSSAPTSAWFGNDETGTYDSEPGEASQGTLSTEPITIPEGTYAALDFDIWVDVEPVADYDVLEVRVQPITMSALGPVVWDKTVLQNAQYATWVPVEVNLSAYAGQTVRVMFRFDSVDGIENDGEGVYVDDIRIRRTCEPVSACVFDGECDDGNACTKDVCLVGICDNAQIPDCCLSNADCDDAYVCTEDSCIDGECVHAETAGCCQFDGECDDGNACTEDLCTAGLCTNQPVDTAGCCATAADCDDGDSCTVDTCFEHQCSYAPSNGAGCCLPASLVNVDFDDATLQGFQVIDDGSGALWSVQKKRYYTPPFGLYFGIPGVWNYDTDPVASGSAISPQFSIPVTAESATLTFRLWRQTGLGAFIDDLLTVRVLDGNQLKTVWEGSEGEGQNEWTLVTVDLSAYVGKTVRLYWTFQAIPFLSTGTGEGVWIDAIDVNTACAP